MNEQNHSIYEFGPFRLDAQKRLLRRNGEIIPLKPKAFDTLLALVEESGRVLEKNELMKRIWPDTVVEEGNLTFNISSLRKALGDDPRLHQYIVTIPGEGYRFVAGVHTGFDELEVRERTRVTIEEERERETGVPVSAPYSFSLVDRFTRRRAAVVAVSVSLLAAVAMFLAWSVRQRDARQTGVVPPGPFQQMEIKRVTATGNARDAAISPDGRYIAYVLRDGEKQSIHLMQVGTNSSVQIRPPSEVSYGFPVFAPDGKSLYYYVSKEDQPRTLYRSDVLGGVEQKVLTGFSGPVTLSPDGKQLAFVRNYPERGETALVVANAVDGSGEYILVARKIPESFSGDGPSWSPDGKMIALGATKDFNRAGFQVLGVRVSDGKVERLSDYEWSEVDRVAWLGDGSGLVLVEGRQGEFYHGQLWYVSYPGAEVRRITNDLADYKGVTLSVSADSRSLVTVELQTTSNIWVLAEGDPARARQISLGPIGRYDGFYGLAWTPDGKIVYSSHTGDSQAIWMMDGDGANARQLTPVGRVDNSPVVTADRRIVFRSLSSGGSEIWRMDADGSNPVQLTFGADYNPSVSPDGKWVIYASLRGRTWGLWKISIDGGEPVQLTDKASRWPTVSPDGKFIACTYEGRIAVIPFAGGSPIKTFILPRTAVINEALHWMPDGQALMIRDAIQGVWRQPLDGGAPVRLTDLGPERTFNLAWSLDGKQLALARGTQNLDVVLIRDLR